MNKKYYSGIMIGIITLVFIVGYITTFSLSSYASNEKLDKSVLGRDKGESIQKTIPIAQASTDRMVNNNTILQFKKAPEFYKIEGSINSYDNQSISIGSLKGKVVFVNFWTYSCINVLRTLPYLLDWDSKYSNDGLVIIGVHTTKFKFEKNIENVKSAIQDME